MRGPYTLWILAVLVIASLGAGPREASLVETLRAGDTKAARALLQQGADVNAPAVDGTSPLHWAVHHDDAVLVDTLLRAGARANVSNRYGVSPISLAATNGNASIIQRLLQAGADPNSAMPGGETVLMTAARTGVVDAVKVLIAGGAAVNAKEQTRGQTALMWAAAHNNTAVIRALAQAGADVHARSKEPHFQQGWLVGNGAGPLPTEEQIEFTALLFAVREGHIEAVRALLDSGANVNETAPNGTTALLLATMNNHWQLSAFLLDRGADPNAATRGWTALHQVARSRAPSSGGIPPPVETGRLTSLQLAGKLLDHGANINARMTKEIIDGNRNGLAGMGATPFLLAAKGVDMALMRVLLARGADPTLSNVNGTTPLLAAAGVELAAQGHDPGTPEEALIATKFLFEIGAGDALTANRDGETALHGAAYRGANPLVEYLVAKGAKLEARTSRSSETRRGDLQTGLIALDYAIGRKVQSTVRAQPHTVALLVKLMKERGLPIDEASLDPTSPTLISTTTR